MRRVRFQLSILTLIALPLAGTLPAQSAETKLDVPIPVAADRNAVPVPEQKPHLTEAQVAAITKELAKKIRKETLAKILFGSQKAGADLKPRAIGWYSKGCLAGGEHLSDHGDAWQTMRPSRNRAWGHPKLIALVKRLAREAKEEDGWPGLLVGDIAQPRGGPMLSGHASHQVGLDADVWLNPMPDRILTVREREDTSAISMLDDSGVKVDPKLFTPKHVALIKRAASYSAVERIFVHPAIKKALCEAAGTDRDWLGKVRPLWGHHYHFHIRIGCPNGGCRHQPPVSGEDGCGKEVDNWLKRVAKVAKPKPSPKPSATVWIPPSARRMIKIDQLPAECRSVLDAPATRLVEEKLPTPKPEKTTAKN